MMLLPGVVQWHTEQPRSVPPAHPIAHYSALAVILRTLPPPQPSPAADAGASCEGGGRWVSVAATVGESFAGQLFFAERIVRQSPLSRRSAPSLAGRSPQRGRVGVGVGNIVDEAEFWFFTFAAIILALFCFASNACCCCAGGSSPTGTNIARVAREGAYQRYSTIFVPAFTGEGAHYPASAATSRTLPPPQPSPAAGFALRGRGQIGAFRHTRSLIHLHTPERSTCM